MRLALHPGCRLSARPSARNARGCSWPWLLTHARAVVRDAVQTIQARAPGVHIDMGRVSQLGSQIRHAQTLGISAGHVWLNAGGTIVQLAIRARFNGTVEWYWVLESRAHPDRR